MSVPPRPGRVLTLAPKIPPQLAQPSVSAFASSSVIPGQPVPIVWSYYSGLSFVTNATVMVNIYVTDPSGNEFLANDAPFTYVGPLPSAAGIYGTGSQAATLIPPTAEAANILYTVGLQFLTLKLQVVDASGTQVPNLGPLTIVFLMNVLPDTSLVLLPSMNFTFTGPTVVQDGMPVFDLADPLVFWKDMYSVTGSLAISSQYADYTIVSAVFTETDANTGVVRTILPSVLPTTLNRVEPGQPPPTATIDSGLITQQWQWFDPTLYNIDGPLADTLSYVLLVSLHDQYGNSYPQVYREIIGGRGPDGNAIQVGSIGVQVVVDVLKEQAEENAVTDLGAAIYFTGLAAVTAVATAAAGWTGIGAAIGAAIAAGFGLTAFGFQQAASGQANRANDPPPPDFLTRESFQTEVGKLPNFGEYEKVFPNLISFLRLQSAVHHYGRAFDQIQAKVAGAVITEDKTGIRLQLQESHRLAALIENNVRDIKSIMPNIVAEMRTKSCPASSCFRKGV